MSLLSITFHRAESNWRCSQAKIQVTIFRDDPGSQESVSWPHKHLIHFDFSFSHIVFLCSQLVPSQLSFASSFWLDIAVVLLPLCEIRVHEQRVERSRGLLPDSLVTSGISTIDSSFSTSSSTTSSSASSFYSTSSSSTSSTTLGYKKRGGRGGSSSGGATIGMAHTAGKEMTSSRLRNNATSARIESLEVLQELEELEAEHVEEEEKEDVRDGDDDGREEKTWRSLNASPESTSQAKADERYCLPYVKNQIL